MCNIEACVSCLKGTIFCKTLDPNTSPTTAAHLSIRRPLLYTKYLDFLILHRSFLIHFIGPSSHLFKKGIEKSAIDLE
jgi:hypothetical protein